MKMIFFKLFVYTLAAFAISEQLVYFSGPFKIYDKIRNIATEISENLGELFSCMACMSTWIGIILSILDLFLIPSNITPFNIIYNGNTDIWYFIIPLDSAYTCATVWLLYRLEEIIDKIDN